MLKEDYMEHISKLAQENIWIEIARGLSGENPEIFIKGLYETGQLKTVLPEVAALFGIPQPPENLQIKPCHFNRVANIISDLARSTIPPHSSQSQESCRTTQQSPQMVTPQFSQSRGSCW